MQEDVFHPDHYQSIICGVAFARSSLRRIASYASVVAPRRLASDALPVIRNRPEAIETINCSRIRVDLGFISTAKPRLRWGRQRLLSQSARLLHFPSASQGLINSHQIQGNELIALDQGILSQVESALGHQYANEIGEPMTI
jgi:hypothetical protein